MKKTAQKKRNQKVLKKAAKKSIKDHAKNSAQYLKYSCAIEFLFWTLTIVSFIFLILLLVQLVSGLETLNETHSDPLNNPADLRAHVAGLKSTFTYGAMYIVIWAIAMLLIWSTCKGLIWANLLQTKFTRKFFTRFLVLNCIWFCFFVIPNIIFLKYIHEEIAMMITFVYLLVLAHFVFVSYTLFSVKKNPFNIIGEATIKGVQKPQVILPNYMLLALLFYVIAYLLQKVTASVTFLGIILLCLTTILFFSFARGYLHEILKDVSERKEA